VKVGLLVYNCLKKEMLMSIRLNDYSMKNVLLWGTCKEHLSRGITGRGESTWKGRIVHLLIGALEISPVVGHVVAIAEKLLLQQRPVYGPVRAADVSWDEHVPSEGAKPLF
jgi:hypothetical protein